MEVDCSLLNLISWQDVQNSTCDSDGTLSFKAVILSLKFYFIGFITFGVLFQDNKQGYRKFLAILKKHVVSAGILATFRLDYEYEIEYD